MEEGYRDWRLDQNGQVIFQRPKFFEYRTVSKREIRLIKFHPGNIRSLSLGDDIGYKPTEEQLKTILTPCELICTTLEDAPPYVALSYAWGDPSLTHHIIINNSPFPVTKNLFDFFAAVGEHYLGNDLPLWIDAVCIDQLNFEERSQQVQHMAEIYDHALQIHAWLGPGTPSTALGIQKLTYMCDEIQRLASESHGGISAAFAAVNPRNPSFFDASDPKDVLNWKSISSLINGFSWWTRAWVVQEVTSKPEVWIFCGQVGVKIFCIGMPHGYTA
jgi:hypothetical protein